MTKPKFPLLIILVIFASLRSYAQNLPDLENYATEGSNLPNQPKGVVGNSLYNIDLFTGIGNINIPIYPYEIDGMDLGVSLNYSTQGIRVDDMAGVVGLGWNLNYGPFLSRKTAGLEDEAAIINHFLPVNNTYHTVKLGNWYNGLNTNDQADLFTAFLPSGDVRFKIGYKYENGKKEPLDNGSISDDNIIYKDKRRFKIYTSNTWNNTTTGYAILTDYSSRIDFEIRDEKTNCFLFMRGDHEAREFIHNVPSSNGVTPYVLEYYPVNNWTIRKVITTSGMEIKYSYIYVDVDYASHRFQQVEEVINPQPLISVKKIIQCIGKVVKR